MNNRNVSDLPKAKRNTFEDHGIDPQHPNPNYHHKNMVIASEPLFQSLDSAKDLPGHMERVLKTTDLRTMYFKT